MDRLNECKELLQMTQQRVVSSTQEWTSFLRFASGIYKYDFTSALLIYARRPDATALAPIETWNRVGRRVNTGAKGIPTIIDTDHWVTLKFLFDVSDTHGEEKTFPQPWEFSPDKYNIAITDFEDRYGITANGAPFSDFLGTVIRHTLDQDYGSIENFLQDNPLPELKGINEQEMFYETVLDSMKYMIYSRVLPHEIPPYLAFSGLSLLKQPEHFTLLGEETVRRSCTLLRQIESTVKQIEHEQKRSMRHGISGERRVVVSGTGSRGAGGRQTPVEVRNDVQKIPERGTSGPVRDSAEQSGADGSLPSGGAGSERVRGQSSPAAAQGASGTEDGRLHGDGAVQQLAVQDGGGNDARERGVPEPVIENEPTGLLKAESLVGFSLMPTINGKPAYTAYLSDYDFLHSYFFPALKNDQLLSIRESVYDFYIGNEPNEKDAARFLKNAYSVPKDIIFHINNSESWVWFQKKGIYLDIAMQEGEYCRTVTWNECEKHIRNLIDTGDFIEGKPAHGPQQLTFGALTPVSPGIPEEKPADPPVQEPTAISEDVKTGSASGFEELEKEEPKAKSETSSAYSLPVSTGKTGSTSAFDYGTERINFQYTDTQEFAGGQKTHYKANVEAIKLLKAIEQEQRLATLEEQQVLVKYVGWGGIPQAFDKKNEKWQKEYEELNQLLSPEEYTAARASTLTAFYTPPAVISAVHTALKNFGFTGGNILEPSCGTGRFFGFIPENIENFCNLSGVELDSITGRIAQQLYQKASIQIRGFEKTAFPDNFFDLAFGNVPFGEFKVPDTRYSKQNFLIHDYFFAKALDKVRPGGLIVFVTSKGTLDKANPEVRRYIARRAELIGAIRFPNTMMYTEGNTRVTSDLIFLQKRDCMVDIEPEWVNLTYLENEVPVNTYFADHPEMMLGDMVFDDSMYGNAKDTALMPHKGKDWREELIPAVNSLQWTIQEPEIEMEDGEAAVSIPADPNVRNYTYTIVENELYFRENSQMILQNITGTREQRIRGMIEIRDTLREVIRVQSENYPDDVILTTQAKLEQIYDSFTYKYGYLTGIGNKLAFSSDSDYPLLTSLENIDEDGKGSKAAIFTKRTIRPPVEITSCETAVEALPHCLDVKGCVDIPYIAQLVGKPENEILDDLKGLIYRDPQTGVLETADAYLSGNVRQKLTDAETAAESDDQYAANVEALRLVQPKDLDASQIDVKLGSPLLDRDDIKQFIVELLKPDSYDESHLKVRYIPSQATWKINGIYHAGQRQKVLPGKTYGTSRIDAYELIEISLNQKIPTIRDKQPDNSYKMNQRATAAARDKQRVIERKFDEWVFGEPQRRERLVWKYNQIYNNTRIRKFDGSYLTFPGMTPEITLNPHQRNAVARILQSGNTLLAHCVGAGKTYTMITAAMESKRLGLCNKSMMVVPGHLIDQWGADILKLYPGANVLLATKKDFEKHNRQRLVSRIATGDYDIVVIAQSSFEKIPVSPERIERLLNKQISDIMDAMEIAKEEDEKDWTVKAMERTKKGLEEQLEKLTNQSRKDNLLTFEQLGVDQLFVDEAHYYKNLFVATKMINVAGIGQQKAQKASDMQMKCRYVNEIHNRQRGVVFATGTPVSNSMAELFTMQTYLEPEKLEAGGISHFDAWAANYGRVVSSLELRPDGTQYQYKSRFAEFVNLPELMSLYSQVADIQSAEMLKLPVPSLKTGAIVTVLSKPSEEQIQYVDELVDRYERIHNGEVEAWEDNALKATTDGRACALDMRMINPYARDFAGSKINMAVSNIYDIWKQTVDIKGTQMVFCDLSTPHEVIHMEMIDGVARMVDPNGKVCFNAYYDIRHKLLQLGVPEDEIAFIHDAKTEKQKEALFASMRTGRVRILLGSTPLMGAGTNAQRHLIALHHLDAPWRPADVEQREGRILRQGNENPEVGIYRYVTEGTFDAFSWQILEQKQRFISQISHGNIVDRHAADIDNTALDYATVKMIASKDPRIKEREELRVRVAQLSQLKAEYNHEKYSLEDDVLKRLPEKIKLNQQAMERLRKDIILRDSNASEDFSIQLLGKTYGKREAAGAAILKKAGSFRKAGEYLPIGEYQGFRVELTYSEWEQAHSIVLCGATRRITEMGHSAIGCTARMDNLLRDLETTVAKCQHEIDAAQEQLKEAKAQLALPWEHEQEYNEKTQRLNQLDIEMAADIGSDQEQVVDSEEIEEDPEMVM